MLRGTDLSVWQFQPKGWPRSQEGPQGGLPLEQPVEQERIPPAHYFHWSASGEAPRMQRHAPGELHVMRITGMALRERKEQDDGAQVRIQAELRGVPSTGRSRMRTATLSFIAEGGAVPRPVLDEHSGRAEIRYPVSELSSVLEVLHAKGEHTCYFWRSAGGEHAIAWLITLG